MFDRVVLRAMRRIVRGMHRQASQIGKMLQVVLESNGTTAAAASAVEQRQYLVSAAIPVNSVMFPPVKHAINDEVRGVVTRTEMHVSFVPPHVVDAVREPRPIGAEGNHGPIQAMEPSKARGPDARSPRESPAFSCPATRLEDRRSGIASSRSRSF
jgi:hypothetical protein